jgi:dimethylamine monooxygenase subunit B
MNASALRRVRVAEIERVADDIKRFRFVDASGAALPAFSAGSHVVVTMPDANGHSWKNPYSLIGAAGDRSSYDIGVLRLAASRGGSVFMHDRVHIGTELFISDPVNLFPVAKQGRKHILLAGGIGITPFVAMAHELAAQNADFELHYKLRDLPRAAFHERLLADYGSRVRLYRKAAGEDLSLEDLLRDQPLGTHMYVCGPAAMINWALHVARSAGWPDENLHSERFSAPPSGHAFSVKLARSNREIVVGPQQSILEALEDNGIDAQCLCRGGACGQCETRVVASDGPLQHNDHYLTDEDKSRGEAIMICVSRATGRHLTLDL